MTKRRFTEPSIEEGGQVPRPDTPGTQPCVGCELAPPEQGAAVRLKTLRELLVTVLREVDSLSGGGPSDGQPGVDLSEEVRRYETRLILWALTRAGGRRRLAARMLNLKVATLNAKIRRYRIQPPEPPGESDVSVGLVTHPHSP